MEPMPVSVSPFQSTLLMRGATTAVWPLRRPTAYFNPRSSCEERRYALLIDPQGEYFNPRSSCEERLAFATKNNLIT